MTAIPVTGLLAEFAAQTPGDAIPAPVRQRAAALTLDLLGSVVRAGHEPGSTDCLMAVLADLDLDRPGPARVPGLARGHAPATAALVIGMLGHTLDFDDTHAASSLHPSAPVVAAAFAAGQAAGASGAEVLSAIVIGYEVCCRLGNALDPAAHYARGFHPTATAGTFGAAAAAGRLWGLGADAMAAAFGVAGSQAAGSLQFLANGAWNKRWQVGQAAMNGVLAAALARRGFVGAAAPIEGKAGFLHAYTDGADPAVAVANLGTDWETLKIGVKPYPSCRYTHAALDGLAALRATRPAADFLAVEVGLHRNGIKLTADPIDKARRARSVVDGQFSMPFTAAVMIDQGAFGWDDFARLGDPALDALADRVRVVRDATLEAAPHPFGARLRVTFPDGVVERRIPDPSGEPATFPDAAARRAKFMALAEPVLGAGAADLAALIEGLDDVPDLRAALSRLC